MIENRLSCFLIGLGIGAGVSTLFALKSGKETRALIGAKVDEGKDLLVKSGAKARASAAELLERGKANLKRPEGPVANAVPVQ